MRLVAVRTFLSLVKSRQWRTIRYRIRNRWQGLDLGFVDVDQLGANQERVKDYDDSGGPLIEDAIRTLGISPSDRLLDFGCGKAGAILTFAKSPFAQVDGVEISERLVQIARANLRKMRLVNSVIYRCDAAEFTDLDQYTHFYMYNPFPQAVMRCVTENIAASALRRKRKLTLIYTTPCDHEMILAAGFKKVAEIIAGLRVFIYVMGEAQNASPENAKAADA
jgi:hypothetical protein